MERQTFVLTRTKPFRHYLKLYVKVGDKVEQRSCEFTTAHKVSEKERNRNARTVAAEFSTSNPIIVDALYCDSGYGKIFVHKDDPEGERSKTPYKLSPKDKTKLALEGLFKMAGLEFDPSKDSETLEKEYQIHMTAVSGRVIKQGKADSIPHEKVDVQKNMQELAESARKAYEDKYGEPVPEDYYNNLPFLSALSDPNFDAKAYMEEDSKSGPEPKGNDLPETVEELQKLYFETFKQNPPNPKKNNAEWLKAKIKEEKEAQAN